MSKVVVLYRDPKKPSTSSLRTMKEDFIEVTPNEGFSLTIDLHSPQLLVNSLKKMALVTTWPWEDEMNSNRGKNRKVKEK